MVRWAFSVSVFLIFQDPDWQYPRDQLALTDRGQVEFESQQPSLANPEPCSWEVNVATAKTQLQTCQGDDPPFPRLGLSSRYS